MRDFTSVSPKAMISEVNRDLSKSPVVHSSRVQNQKTAGITREALNYGYVVDGEKTLDTPFKEFIDAMAEYSDFYKSPENRNAVRSWIQQEAAHRFMFPEVEAPLGHPELAFYLEGNTFSYSYGERLGPYLDTAMTTLITQPSSRRVWLPIYHPEDLVRSGQFTRIPCSLGYGALIRKGTDGRDYLHVTYFQRSCDFEIFWITDLYLAAKFQEFLMYGLSPSFPDLKVGKLTHNIISFHRFLKEDEEIY